MDSNELISYCALIKIIHGVGIEGINVSFVMRMLIAYDTKRMMLDMILIVVDDID